MTQTPPFPPRKYSILYADPPWSYFGDPNKPQAAGKHYSLMPTDTIKALPIQSITNKKAACFLWATGPKLPEAIEVLSAWGFYYRGVAAVWVKTNNAGRIINGQGVRPTFVKPTTELLLVGSTNKKGRAFPLLTEAQAQVVLASRPNNKHSSKSAIFRDRILDLLGDLPRIELFARSHTTGWDSWGLEAPIAAPSPALLAAL